MRACGPTASSAILCRFVSASSSTPGSSNALCGSLRFGRGRSLSADDPFGERAAWEDPSATSLNTFKQFDEAAFDAAASSEAVAKAHFGPEWSRFSTIGRMSTAALHANAPSAQPRSAEELHEADLARKARVMERNYATYEEFVAKELAGGKGMNDPDAEERGADDGRPVWQIDVARDAVVSHDAVADGYRVSQIQRRDDRLVESAAAAADGGRSADEVGDADDDEGGMPPLPAFTSSRRGGDAGPDDAFGDDVAEAPQHVTPNGNGGRSQPSSSTDWNAQEITTDTVVLPATDPKEWTTDQVIMWVREVGSEGAMDDSMAEAFQMMRVDGEMLLKKVTPNTLFKCMRRWHLKRKALYGNGADVATVNAESVAALKAEFQAAVSVLLVQETIYLCYPYGR